LAGVSVHRSISTAFDAARSAPPVAPLRLGLGGVCLLELPAAFEVVVTIAAKAVDVIPVHRKQELASRAVKT